MYCLLDNINKIGMWLSLYDLFATRLGIDEIWNQLDCLRILLYISNVFSLL